MTTLYEKRGRKYVPVSERWQTGDDDQMSVGEFRLTYCYANGGKRYEYKVVPATASWAAAAMIARHAMEEAIRDAMPAKPQPIKLTKRQQEILKRYRKDMTEAGGMFPTWWEHTSAWDLSNIAIKAVEEFKP
jgi:hypothetical protein